MAVFAADWTGSFFAVGAAVVALGVILEAAGFFAGVIFLGIDVVWRVSWLVSRRAFWRLERLCSRRLKS